VTCGGRGCQVVAAGVEVEGFLELVVGVQGVEVEVYLEAGGLLLFLW